MEIANALIVRSQEKKAKITPKQLHFTIFTPDFIWCYQYLAPPEIVPG
jgi:hypothetical protein